MLNDPFAAQMALLAMRAEDMFDKLKPGEMGRLDPELDHDVAKAYDLLGYISGNDALLAPDRKTHRPTLRAANYTVFYGFLVRAKANLRQHFAVIRGTGDLLEWIKDLQGVPIPHQASGGLVEMGFYTIYETMRYHPIASRDAPLAQGIADAIPDGKATIVGHSLGSALGTYLALDLVAIGKMGERATTCMFASPHAGDVTFVDHFDSKLSAYTLYNYSRDFVTTVPFAFGYSSLPRTIRFTPAEAQASIAYKNTHGLVDIPCQHHAVCYAAMLDFHATDWKRLPQIDQKCAKCIIGPKPKRRPIRRTTRRPTKQR